jgi:NADPH:quinone reductase-like Zn-dependent oxidoreductase
MRAFVLTRYGGPEQTALSDVPQPLAGARALLVRVRAAGLNPVDLRTRGGALRLIHSYQLPIVMGNELSGVVEAAGPGVTRFAKNDRVFARVAKDVMGAFAEYAVVHEARERFEDKLSGYDGAFDLLGGDTLARLWSVVKPGGRVVSIAGVPEPLTARKDLGRGRGLAALFWIVSLTTRIRAARHGISYRYLFMHPSGGDLDYLASLIVLKQLEVVVDRVYPFAEVREAMAYLETGRAKGKVVLSMS